MFRQPSRGTARMAGGSSSPYATTTTTSGASSDKRDAAAADLSDAGCSTTRPRSSARCLTALAVNSRPRPAGRSGCV